MLDVCRLSLKGSLALFLLNSTEKWYGKRMRDTFCSLQKSLTEIYKGRSFFTDHQLTQNNAQNHIQMLSAWIHMLFPLCVGYLLFMVAFNPLATFSKCVPQPIPTHVHTPVYHVCALIWEEVGAPLVQRFVAPPQKHFLPLSRSSNTYSEPVSCLLSVYVIFPNLLLSALLCNKELSAENLSPVPAGTVLCQ